MGGIEEGVVGRDVGVKRIAVAVGGNGVKVGDTGVVVAEVW